MKKKTAIERVPEPEPRNGLVYFSAEALFTCGWVPCRVIATGDGETTALVIGMCVARDGEIVQEAIRINAPEGHVLRMRAGSPS